MKTFNAKPSDIKRKWYVLDASEAPLGRLASKVAVLLTGKTKPEFTAHIDIGDYVIITNSDKLVVTGNKKATKTYYHHSGYPGGLRSTSLEELMAKDSTKVIFNAVRGMLPVNKLRDERLKRVKIYTGSEHNHQPQQPEVLSLKEGK